MHKLHLVMGGRVSDPQGIDFVDLKNLYWSGLGDFASAEDAWRENARRTIDDAEMKYVIVHLHRLLEPELLGGLSRNCQRSSRARPGMTAVVR